MSYKKIVLFIDDFYLSIIDLKKFNPNFNNPSGSYTELVFDENNKLVIHNNEKLYYDKTGRLSKIISTEFTDNNIYLTYISTFKYFDDNILKNTLLIKSESFFSANNLTYTSDGINYISEIPEEHNKLTSSEILSYEKLQEFLNIKLYFYNQLDYKDFEYGLTEKITFQDEEFMSTISESITQFGNKIIKKKKYLNQHGNNKFMLIEIEAEVEYIDGAGYGSKYDENGNLIEYHKGEKFYNDLEAEYNSELRGKQLYNYDNYNNINYMEDEYSIAIIKINKIEEIKIEEGIIISKKTNKINPWYTLYETEINSLKNYSY